MIFDGVRFTYRLIVPPYGKFVGQNDQSAGCLCHEKYIDNVTGAFDVSGYRVRSIHQATDHFGGEDDRTAADSDQYNLDQQFSRPHNDINPSIPGPLSERVTTNKRRRITSPDLSARHTGSSVNQASQQRPGLHCRGSKHKPACEKLPMEKRCTRCLQQKLKCLP